ncbi:hypothetical protein OQA88_2820 [Cercophora sp. LCS_1]
MADKDSQLADSVTRSAQQYSSTSEVAGVFDLMGPPMKLAGREELFLGPEIRGGERDTIDSDTDYSSNDLADYETNDDWSTYGRVPQELEQYHHDLEMVDGSNDWNKEQRKVHRLVYMRGFHPMLPSTWKMSYKIWGVTQPELNDVFAPPESNKAVVISARGNEVAGAKALEALFILSQTVTDCEEMDEQDKIGPLVVKAILTYIKWAHRDIGVDAKKFPPLFVVHNYPPDFADSEESTYGGTDAGNEDSEMSGLDDLVPSIESTEDEDYVRRDIFDTQMTDDESAGELEATRRFTRAITRDLEGRMQRLAEEWRACLWDARKSKLDPKKAVGFKDKPPTLYGFAVVQHMVMVVSLDASEEGSRVVSLETVDLYNRGQWLWNALSIAIPINTAKDALAKIDRFIEQRPRQKDLQGTNSDSDPDR